MKFIVALLALTMGSAFAADIQVMDAALPVISSYDAQVDARFQMDKTTGEGSVVVTVTEMRWTTMGGFCDQWGRCYPQRVNMPVTVFTGSAKVKGLMLHGDQMIFMGRDGDVNCGRLGESSVFHRPTLFLTGNCKLSATISGNWANAHAIVMMKTK